MKLTKISIERAVSEVSQETFGNTDYIGQFKTLSAITKDHKDLFQFYGFKYFKRIAEEGIIVRKLEGSKTLYSLQSIAEYNYLSQQFKEHYLTLPEAIKILGYQKKNNHPYSHIDRFLYMKEKGFMNVILLNHKVNNNEYFVSKIELANFRENYISFPKVAAEAGLSISSLKYRLKNYKKPIVLFFKDDVQFSYLFRKDWIDFSQDKSRIDEIAMNKVSMYKAANILEISTDSLEKVALEYSISFDRESQGRKYFLKDDVEFLKKEQDKLWKNIQDTYFTKEEASKNLGVLTSTLAQSPYRENIKSIFVPPLICTIKNGISFKKGLTKIYFKEDVLDFINKNEPDKVFNNLLSTLETDSYSAVLTILKELDLQFNSNGKVTEEYWKKYLKKKSLSSRASNDSKRKSTRVDFNTSKLLIQLTVQKEIFMHSTNELNLAIFNANLPSSTKLEVYKFLKVVAESRMTLSEVIKFNATSLPNLYARKGEKTDDKTIYPINQFINLIDYIKDVNKHKSLAIESINLCRNSQDDKHYDSSWLYVLLHLNNAWRHHDITMFPRINLEQTRFNNLDPELALDWLGNNVLNENELHQIMNQVSALKFIHSKTKKRRYFFCSEELISAFVHSVILCELRCRLTNPLSNTLIDFDNRARNFKEVIKKNFFSNFNSDFNFKSKQMNRTLISYIYSVIKKTTNRNPLEVTKYIRSHASIETTNIYIDIPQEQMDFITKQLFSMGNFGYAYDALGELLLDNSSSEREVKTEQSLMIKEIFGDIHQIEQLANYLKRLTADQNSVRKVLQGYSVEERKLLSNTLKLGQQPAKKEGYQCIYSKCPYPSKDCEKCPFVISHFYALSQLSEDFDKQLTEFKTKFPLTTKQGEKIRLSNNLYSYIHLIGLAVKQFGEGNVSAFFNQDLKDIKKEIGNIPSVKHLVTIPDLRKADNK
ncbi:hypothetical protein [Paenisporosarcina sp. TG-14]|uniref:hypothetical protein n=1 Tax=Paenisporosarcina sp. TG-14 TaxID=1231057 RepID=UPI0002F956B4|nr:hypothetical protein [Paenisporosarcina sp. TG-14]